MGVSQGGLEKILDGLAALNILNLAGIGAGAGAGESAGAVIDDEEHDGRMMSADYEW